MNTNRQRGDYLERQTRDALRAHGWFVIRAAGSHGIADLVALRRGFTPLLLSCKLDGKIGLQERSDFVKAGLDTGARPLVAYREKRGYVDLAVVHVNGKNTWIDQLKVPARRSSSREEEE